MSRHSTPLATVLVIAALAAACGDNPVQAAADPALARGGAPGSGAGGSAMVEIYEADLMALNGSGVMGTARFMVVNGMLKATVHAKGLTPNRVHPQHIHGLGLPATQDAVCPAPSAADDIAGLPEEASDPDQFISLEEGLPAYGGVLVPLDSDLSAPMPGSFPMANAAGVLNYQEKTALPVMTTQGSAAAAMLDLEERAVVLHGMVLDGTYAVTLPVACGTITRVK